MARGHFGALFLLLLRDALLSPVPDMNDDDDVVVSLLVVDNEMETCSVYYRYSFWLFLLVDGN